MNKTVNHINTAEAADQLAADNEVEVESMRKDSFSLHVMRFEPGDEDSTHAHDGDSMHAHDEDEIYFVDTGKATLETEDSSIEVEKGDVIHLDPKTDHQFTGFEDEFVVTVVYAPAEGSQ